MKADSVAELRGDLEQIVGGTHVLTDPDVVAGYVTDWTGNWHGHTAAVVRPANTDEVSRVLARCHPPVWQWSRRRQHRFGRRFRCHCTARSCCPRLD